MAAALETLLEPVVLTRTVSREAAASDWLLNVFGCAPGGANEINEGHGREGAYHIYNNVRTVGQGRAPATSAAKRPAQPVGKVRFTYPRMHDSVDLNAEKLHNLGQIDNPAQRDIAGENMISRQTTTLGQLGANWRKAMLMGLLRGSLYIGFEGDDEWFQFTSPTRGFEVEGQMPAGNKSQLDMLGGGDIIDASWATATTDIPNHVMSINAAFQQLNGGHLSAVIVTHKQWNNVLNNDHIQEIHGSASSPFRTIARSALNPAIADTMENVWVATINVWPDVLWFITDEGLDIGRLGSETYTKIVGDNNAIFLGHMPDDGTTSCYLGSEPIAEYDGGPKEVKTGLASWRVEKSNPTKTDLMILDNALIANHVPNSWCYATVQF